MNPIRRLLLPVGAAVCSLLTAFDPVFAQTPPTIVQAAAANPNPLMGTVNTVTVLGNDSQGETTLIYTWSATSKPPGAADPVFFPNGGGPLDFNGSNAARNSLATYSMAGEYSLQVIIQNMTGLTATSTVAVTVSPILSQIMLVPTIRAVVTNTSYAFTAMALDQFDNPLVPQPDFTWSVTAGGTINNTGLFMAGAVSGGPYTLQAQAGGQSATATIFVALPNQFPQVTLVSPTNGQIFTPGAAGPGGMAINLSTMILDPNGSVTNVEFFANGLLLGQALGRDAAGQPYYTWNNPGPDTYVLFARAQNSDGGSADSSPATIKVIFPPTVIQAATANPNPVTSGTTDSLSVLGADPLGEAGLIYTWSTAWSPANRPEGAVDPLFSPNGNNAAKNSIATYLKAGDYPLQVIIQNGAGLTIVSTVTVTVQSVSSQIGIAPANRLIVTNSSLAFMVWALDQFGDPLASLTGVVWSVTGGGTIDNTGLFTAGSVPGGPFTVQAQAGGVTLTTMLLVESPNQFPQVSLTSPANGQVFPLAHTNIMLSATVVDPAGSVTNVEFRWPPNPYDSNLGPSQFSRLAGDATAPPYSCIWTNPPASLYTLIARVYNNDGTTVDSDPVMFTINSNQPPQITLTSPTNILMLKAGSTNIYTLSATLLDPDNTVTNVEFVELNSGITTGQSAVPPYSTTWTNTELGKFFWVARALEYDGSSVDSPWATVIVEPARVLNVPPLSSYSSARAKIYLDFTGGYVPAWSTRSQQGPFVGTYLPPYDMDGDPTTFSAAELEDIYQMWLRAAEAFSPFNVDVTTINPGEEHFVVPNDCVKAVIGGSAYWSVGVLFGSTNEGGIAWDGYNPPSGYNPPGIRDASTCYVHSEKYRLQWDEVPSNTNRARLVSNMGWLIAHEVGHEFGLAHQHGWDLFKGNSLNFPTEVAEYGFGTWEYITNRNQFGDGFVEDLKCPIMGSADFGHKTIWGVATTSYPFTQDDVAVIASTNLVYANGYVINNGFGFRPPDHGNSIGSADPLTVVGNTISGNGIIQTLDDRDFFFFTTPGGQVSLTISPPSFDISTYPKWGMLDVKAELFAGDGTRLALADHEFSFAHWDPSETISQNLPAGTYFLAVESQGNYGDIGQYTVTGTLVLPLQGLTCPAPIFTNNAPGDCAQLVAFTSVVTGSPSAIVIFQLGSSNITSPYAFAIGTNLVTCTATDAAGLTASCTFTVTVSDNEPPTISGQGADATIQCPATPVFTPPVAVDNCDPNPQVIEISDVTVQGGYPGTYSRTKTWKANDSAGNESGTVSQTITVVDTEAPAPDVAALPTITGQCSATIPAPPTATDNCSGAITGTTTDPLGYHAQGTFTVTWKFTDAAGNSATQTQTVIVRNTVAPVITGVPVSITVAATSPAGAIVTFVSPTALDNCIGSVAVTCSPASGSTFPVGTTTVHCTATDAAGNSANASFTVTVTALDAATQLNALIKTAQGMSIQPRVKTALLLDLAVAKVALQSNRMQLTCGAMSVFEESVAQFRKANKLTAAQASQLTTAARNIRSAIGCPKMVEFSP